MNSSEDVRGLLKSSLLEVRRLKGLLREHEESRHEPIAIIGMGCRFPGAEEGPESYWELLRDGVDATRPIEEARWWGGAYFDSEPGKPGKFYARRAATLDQIEGFDPAFFGISAREAATLSPQQRILLEVTWEALEHANLVPGDLYESRGGVFVGVCGFDFGGCVDGAGIDEEIDAHLVTGSTLSVAAGRLSYFLGLNGPALSVDTACSSSLVAIHVACQSLRRGECDLGLAAGAHLMLGPGLMIGLSSLRALSADGRCKTFDASADGYGRGEGCGVLVLKRLSDAVSDGDRILALIRGSAMNQDGASGGLTVPSGPSQRSVIRQALEDARLAGTDIDYVEAHGTGTALGDPIEIGALEVVYGGRPPEAPLRLGSVKTNVGHLEAASGVAGVIKLVLALQHEAIPPHLHLSEPNPHIPWNDLPLTVPTELSPWPRGDRPRIGGVSSFGLSGTNAHLVIEEAPGDGGGATLAEDGPSAKPDEVGLLALSARSPQALVDLARRYEARLDSVEADELVGICHAANRYRSMFESRLALVAESPVDAIARLKEWRESGGGVDLAGGSLVQGSVAEGTETQVVFLCAGQGSQYSGMAKELYRSEPIFRRALDRCAEILGPLLEYSLIEVLFEGEQSELLHQTAYTQPVLFAVEYALSELWSSWGVRPSIVLGHSVGEYVAACIAGVWSIEDGLRMIAERARLMQALPDDGMMAAVFASESELSEVCGGREETVSIAAVNGPEACVLSGVTAAVEAICAELEGKGINCRRLEVSHAFHSPLMEPMLPAFRQVLSQVDLQPPSVRLISNLTGEFAGAEIATPDYWVRHVRSPVRFAAGLESLRADLAARSGDRRMVLLELGPKATLTAMGRQVLPEDGGSAGRVRWVPSLSIGVDDRCQMRRAAAALFVEGAPIELATIDQRGGRRAVELPTYPFQREPFPLDRKRRQLMSSSRSGKELPGQDWFYSVCWQESRPVVPAGESDRRWLVLADSTGVAAALDELLPEAVLVHRQDAPAVVSGRRLDPLDPEQMEELIEEVVEATAGIVVLWSLDPQPEDADPVASCRPALAGLLHLVQAVARRNGLSDLPIWIVTSGAQSVDGRSAVDAPEQAAIWGLGRVVASENPELFGALVDLDPESSRSEAARFLVEELASGRGDQVAYRNGHRYVARLRSMAVEASAPRVDGNKSYLVTGGFGALGLRVADWLVSRGAGHLVLASRRGEAADGAEDAIRDLQRTGAIVEGVAVDVANEPGLRDLIGRFGGDLPELGGIVHCAGVSEDGLLLNQGWEQFERVLASKVAGAVHLDRLTAGMELDFFVMFSSAASLLGPASQGSYAAANAVLDAVVWSRVERGLPALSINWGPWSGSGMAIRQGALDRLAEEGIEAVAPQAGLRALEWAIAGEEAQLLVLPVDLDKLRARLGSRTSVLFREIGGDDEPTSAGESGVESLASGLASQSTEDRAATIRDLVERGLAKALGRGEDGEVDPDRGFNQMGLDSLMAVELTNHLAKQLGVNVRVTAAFNHPTVNALVEHLLTQMPTTPSDESEQPVGRDAPDPAEDVAAALDRELAELGDLDEA